MYDNDDLERSQFYFSLLQMLRIFSEYIIRNMEDLKLAATLSNQKVRESRMGLIKPGDRVTHQDFANASKIVAWNWEAVLALHATEGRALLDRIARHIATVESLRDGVRIDICHRCRILEKEVCLMARRFVVHQN
jgi:hypothetical protein